MYLMFMLCINDSATIALLLLCSIFLFLRRLALLANTLPNPKACEKKLVNTSLCILVNVVVFNLLVDYYREKCDFVGGCV
ncbi:hypothetical protein CR513_33744, partial [Mucuna pruriens]